MNYFKKTKFRETSLIFVAVFIAIIYFTLSDTSEEQGKAVQEIMDARVEEEKIVTTSTSSTSTTTAVPLSQTEAYAQNNTLDQLVSTETWYLFDADPPKSIYPEDLRRIEVLQTKLSDIYPEVQITSIYDEQTYQYHEKYCKEYNITECSLPYISDEHSYVTTTTTTTTTTLVPTTTTTSTTTTTVVSIDYPQLTISEMSSSIPEYDRDEWNHWIDENGDCQNTRHEVLIEESFETVTYTNDTFCSVSTGKWFGNYTGQYYYNASELDIDHFIPLKNAHQSGGYNWSSAKKEEFANYRLDPDNLIAVNLSANRSKGAKGPDEWKPSNTEYWCEYAYDWIRIKDYWNLTATQAEWDALVSMIETCPAGFAYADAEEEPVAELPTPTTTTTSSTTTTTTTTVVSSQPDNPGDSKNCGDFANYAEAKAWFDKYEPYYGDVARLDRDGDLIPCESLSGAP